MVKTIQMSDDAEVTWYDLPGNSGDLSFEAGTIEDTIFGQSYQSNESGLIGWSVTANGLYKGFAGYVADLKQPGTPTAMVTEAMTLESGKIYQVTDAAKEIWDRSAAFTIFDNAVDETANVEWFDYLFGRIKFLDAHTVTGPVTVTGTYLPTLVLGRGNSFSLTQTADTIDTSYFDAVQTNGGYRTFDPGLRTIGLDVTGIYQIAAGLRAALTGRTELVIEINPDGNLLSLCRGFFRASTEGQSGDVGALEEETTSFVLNVPFVSNLLRPFGWQHDATTTLAESLQRTLTAWEDETKVDVQYLYDGTNGVKGNAVVSDISLSGGLEVMNEFSVTYQGDGVATDVGTG